MTTTAWKSASVFLAFICWTSSSWSLVEAVTGSCIVADGDRSGPELKESKRLKIGAFNIRQFGHKKMSNEDAIDVLVHIIQRYDLLLVQEILDSSYPGKRAIDALLCRLNAHTTKTVAYSVIVSDRVGRLTSREKKGNAHREQYAFIYRSDRFQVRRSYHYDDGDEETFEDEFMREPFIVHFRLNSNLLKDFLAVGLHTRPVDTPAELRNLSLVNDNLRKTFPLVPDTLIMGDLNADCDYASAEELHHVRTVSLPEYLWLIDDDADTTVKTTTDCAYDRILVRGDALLEALPSSRMGSVYKFDQELELLPSIDAYKDISDHYPVEVNLNVG